MQMNSKILSSIKNKVRKYLDNPKVLDIIIFGSFVKGKETPEDIDLAFITKEELNINLPKFHIAILSPEDFFINPPTLVNTLLREGYSIKNNKNFSESYNFKPRVLFNYELSSLNPSLKVKIVNMLRGKKQEKGLVNENNGEWIANQVFIVPTNNENVFEKLFINFKIKFKKKYLLMH